MDPRIKKLADLLIGYSCDIQPGEKILISYEGECCKSLVRQLIKNTYERGGMPYTEIRDSAITREILLGSERGADRVPEGLSAGTDERHGRIYSDKSRRKYIRAVRCPCGKAQYVQLHNAACPSTRESTRQNG